MKTGAVFVDLTAAYDTVWHRGLLVKLSRCMPMWFVETIEMFLRDRRFRVHMGDKVSRWRTQRSGLPQGSVLSPTLFNLYINDMPETTSHKFIYADDICCAAQAKTFTELETTLSSDMRKLTEYFKLWRLVPSMTKTVTSVFHLHNASATVTLNIDFDGHSLKHDPHPCYLGVTLDRALTLKEHLSKTALKIKSRNNLLQKLAGTTWGADAVTLRLTAVALCYSVGEYCAPVWCRSNHTHLVDVQLNNTMRTVSGTIRSTPIEWLPVLSNIAPSHLRRESITKNLLHHVIENPSLPLCDILQNPPSHRLASRRPVWKSPPLNDFSVEERWRHEWDSAEVVNKHLVDDPTKPVAGMDLKRGNWCKLNRFRTNCGVCAASQHKWGTRPNPYCACGQKQTMSHIAEDCSLTKFERGVAGLNVVDADAVLWLDKLRIR